jgi:RimK family alpha-L-glutamate ligase
MRICKITDEIDSYASSRFRREALVNNIKIVFAARKDFFFDSSKDKLFLNKRSPLDKFDAVILRSPEISLMPGNFIVDYCEHKKIRLLNKKFYLRFQSMNKLRQQLLFQMFHISSLKTIYSEAASFIFLKTRLGLPFVAKLANGSLGKQVFKINSPKEFVKFIQERKRDKQIYLFQKFYATDGDYRVFIVGKEVLGPVKRMAPRGDWRSNIKGATHERAEENKQVLQLAKEVLKKTGIEFAGLDILIDKKGAARMIEMNTMAHFKVFDEVFPEINIAKKIIQLLKKSR